MRRHNLKPIDDHALEELILRGIQRLRNSRPDEPSGLLLRFIHLLDKWNRVYNLTSIREPRQMVSRHILDSLVVRPYLHGQRILDVGSGAGLPGIPLAIAAPELNFTLLDSNNKKTRFILQVVTDLGLKNVEVVTARIEEYQPAQGFDTVLARAYSSLEKLSQDVREILNAEGCILAMKGSYPLAELESIPVTFKVDTINKLEVPGLDAERHLVILRAVT